LDLGGALEAQPKKPASKRNPNWKRKSRATRTPEQKAASLARAREKLERKERRAAEKERRDAAVAAAAAGAPLDPTSGIPVPINDEEGEERAAKRARNFEPAQMPKPQYAIPKAIDALNRKLERIDELAVEVNDRAGYLRSTEVAQERDSALHVLTTNAEAQCRQLCETLKSIRAREVSLNLRDPNECVMSCHLYLGPKKSYPAIHGKSRVCSYTEKVFEAANSGVQI